MYVNNIPEDTKNSLANFSHIEELYKDYGPPSHYRSSKTKSSLFEPKKENPYSSNDFQMIKLVERLLVTLPSGRRTFFPYELQIFTRTQWKKIENKQTNHDAYEKRQINAVKERLF